MREFPQENRVSELKPRSPIVSNRAAPTKTIMVGNGVIEAHITSAQTGGALEMFVFNAPPGMQGPPPHSHPGAEETFHVMEGEMEFTVGGTVHRASAGTTLHVPRGVVHHFRYVGYGTTRFSTVLTPAIRLDEYFEKIAAIFRARPGPPEEKTRGELLLLMREYGQEPG
jgi:quercetin dioxygenase-like cupin family protein